MIGLSALVGLFIFSNLMGRLSEVLRYLEEQHDAGARQAAAEHGPGATAARSAEPE